MGLDFSHCDAHWGYGGFMNFRRRLAEKIGIDLLKMDGFTGPVQGYRGISWETVTDQIKPLLDHSDCDGILTPDECKQVYPRLIELTMDWDESDPDKINALELVKGMKLCIENNEDLEFY
ncbi:hypothetical protein P9D39_03540 [Heyndrickxia oleronia]|uniref:Uncharacterized protein n=1 Tax=Heyndrickxia oleronia TaxID=38875 RepID=A0A8E2ID38_9BACI|nr:hypothetical protein [Heyndrickxia oleronia]MEC1373384.1 hypothetical protein [Heyndrickxia oleronia]OOP68825.1 hypothetical protein BWZ43_08360 [Heyndrickxia oleronia]QQZ04319.1 hypothetical protein I5818_22000 [Heyndrickxia oleronia]